MWRKLNEEKLPWEKEPLPKPRERDLEEPFWPDENSPFPPNENTD